MKNVTNNILTIAFKDGSSSSLAFPSARTKEEAIELALKIEKFDKSKVREYYFSIESDKTLGAFNYFDVEKKQIDEIRQVVDFKIDDMRKKREVLFPKLDLAFMRSLEGDCPSCKNHISLIKNYFRNLPSLLKEEFKNYDDPRDIISFNYLNNIFEVMSIRSGSGYINPPTLTIDAPNGKNSGFQLEASASIKDGGVSEINVTKIGSGYIGIPKIITSPPDEPDGQQAYTLAFFPENDIYME